MQPREMAEDLWGNGTDVSLTGPLRLEQGPHQGAPAWEQSQAQHWGSPPPAHILGKQPLPRRCGYSGTGAMHGQLWKDQGASPPPILPMPQGPLMAGA